MDPNQQERLSPHLVTVCAVIHSFVLSVNLAMNSIDNVVALVYQSIGFLLDHKQSIASFLTLKTPHVREIAVGKNFRSLF
jgi:hypothetical protein